MALRSSTSHVAAMGETGKQAWGQSQHTEDTRQEMEGAGVLEDTAELLKTMNWSACLPYSFWVITRPFFLKEGRKEGREGERKGGGSEGREEGREGGRKGFYFLCAQEVGDTIEGGLGDRVPYHDGTCAGHNTWKGLSIFILSNSLPGWQLLYLASLKLFLWLSLCH